MKSRGRIENRRKRRRNRRKRIILKAVFGPPGCPAIQSITRYTYGEIDRVAFQKHEKAGVGAGEEQGA